MLYNKPSNDKAFNDNYVRAVDALFDSLYYLEPSYFYHSLPRREYIKEHRTVLVKLPRQTGKSTYIQSLQATLVRKNSKRFLLVSSSPKSLSPYPIAPYQFYRSSSIRALVGRNFDGILFDEFSKKEIDEFMDSDVIQNTLISTANPIIFGLTT